METESAISVIAPRSRKEILDLLAECDKSKTSVKEFSISRYIKEYHAFRHTYELGLARSAVKTAIEENLPIVADQIVNGKPLNQIIEMAGQKI